MKTKRKLFGFYILILLITIGCKKDKDLEPGNGKLKRILSYATVDAKEPIAISEEYEYDSQDRISKISTPLYNNGVITGTAKYDLYEYNSIGQLASISTFYANKNAPSGYNNLKKIRYTYAANGLKEKETIESSEGITTEYTLYFYNSDSKLMKAEKYNGRGQLENYTSYEYAVGKLIKEIFYHSSGTAINITAHFYENNLNIRTVVYAGNGTDKAREIKKTYNSYGNLIITESKEYHPFSSLLDHVLRYEYN